MNGKLVESIDSRFFRIHEGPILSPYNFSFNDYTRLSWMSSDSEDNFKRNYTNYSNSTNTLERDSVRYYKENPILYTLNKEGFRDSPLHTKPKEVDVYLGCSYTFGEGLHLNHTWASKVKKYLQFPSINAGIPGSGCITHFRVLTMLSKQFNIRNVFYFNATTQARLEWYFDSLEQEDSSYQSLLVGSEKINSFHLQHIFNDRNHSYINLTFKYAMEGFCKANNINLYRVYEDLNLLPFKEYVDYDIYKDEFIFNSSLNFLARDISHMPVKSNHFVYLLFLHLLGVDIFKNSKNKVDFDNMFSYI